MGNDGTYRNDTFQIPIQTVDVLQHLFHTLLNLIRITCTIKQESAKCDGEFVNLPLQSRGQVPRVAAQTRLGMWRVRQSLVFAGARPYFGLLVRGA